MEPLIPSIKYTIEKGRIRVARLLSTSLTVIESEIRYYYPE